ncbi:hypothetical protein BDR26DRAFT_179770 [Obelidium mucronatum]|nr:hypothetical protein BDR26DRAFT_179770 [Obelidium mucronatum]
MYNDQILPLLSELQVPPFHKITTLALVMPDANSTNLCHRAMQYLDALPRNASYRVQAELYQNSPLHGKPGAVGMARTPSQAGPSTSMDGSVAAPMGAPVVAPAAEKKSFSISRIGGMFASAPPQPEEVEQSGVFSTVEALDGIVPLREFILKDKDQAKRKGIAGIGGKQAHLLQPLNNAVRLASQDNLHKLVIFTSGDVNNSKDKQNDLAVVMKTLFSKDIPVVIYHTANVTPGSTLDLLQKHGAQLLPLGLENRTLQNPFSVTCEIPRTFGLRQDVTMRLGFALLDMQEYDPRYTYIVKIGGGKYFTPVEFLVPTLTLGNSSQYNDTQVLRYNTQLSQILNDVELLENIPERFTIHIFKCADQYSRILLDTRTVGYLFSFRHILLTLKPLTPLVIGFAGSGKSSFINSVKFVALNDPIPAAQVGGYNAQMTSSLDQLDIGKHTLFDTMGMVTGYTEASYSGDEVELILTNKMPVGVKWADMLGRYFNKKMEFGEKPLTFEVVNKYLAENPDSAIFSPKEIDCVLGIVKWDSLNSDKIVLKMEYLSQQFANMNKTVVWAASWVDGKEEMAEFDRIASRIKFAKVLPLSNFTPKISSHDAYKERSIVRVMMALDVESRSHRSRFGSKQGGLARRISKDSFFSDATSQNQLPYDAYSAPPVSFNTPPVTSPYAPVAFNTPPVTSPYAPVPSQYAHVDASPYTQSQYAPVIPNPRKDSQNLFRDLPPTPQEVHYQQPSQPPPPPSQDGGIAPLTPLTAWRVSDVKNWIRSLDLMDGYTVLQKIEQGEF